MEHILEHARLIGIIVTTAAFGGGFAVIMGKAVVRKWLMNGADDKMDKVIDKIESMSENTCPVARQGGTPLTAEQHEVICSQQRLLNKKDNELVLEKVKHVDMKVDHLISLVKNGGK